MITVIETDDPEYPPCPIGTDGHPTSDPDGGPCQSCIEDDMWDEREPW